ncbi:MAG: hypothetical protein LUQ68_08675 [Methylococcaceae bacterium]|nr:hypothetical protein [Methylococcaceae bacterium]
MSNQAKAWELQQKATAVIYSCKTPAQLRTAAAFAYRALGAIGQLLGDGAFTACHEKLRELLNIKIRQMRGKRRYWDF